jgi:two-component system nitrogen regulation response regulator GlnG
MSADPLEPPTLIAENRTHNGEDVVARIPAITILWHPDTGRIGETAILVDPRTEVSRLKPIFHPRGTTRATGTPLSEPYLSAKTPTLAIVSNGGVLEITAISDSKVKIDGLDLKTKVVLSKGDLERGAVVVLGRRIVLCLHLVRSHRSPSKTGHGLVGSSDVMDEIRGEIGRVADLDVPVLLRGETGTGKGMVAAALVAGSTRADRPFLSLNMGATLASTAAAHLFGHERGAFTGAATSAQGLFAAADQGTLFLDEVGLAPPDIQKMLLLAVEKGEVLPLGATRVRKIDVRLIAATDADLEAAIAAGTFSSALFQRLARYQITVPPVRHRREDFGRLLVHFIRRDFEKYGEPDRLAVPGDAMPWLSAVHVAALAVYRWPGNVRELENVAGQIVLFSRGQETASLPPSVRSLLASPVPEKSNHYPRGPAGNGPSDEQVAEAISRHGSVNQAAAALRMSRTKFYELRVRNPLLRSINAITDSEILECSEKFGGDIARMAEALRISRKALKDRLARIGGSRRS